MSYEFNSCGTNSELIEIEKVVLFGTSLFSIFILLTKSDEVLLMGSEDNLSELSAVSCSRVHDRRDIVSDRRSDGARRLWEAELEVRDMVASNNLAQAW